MQHEGDTYCEIKMERAEEGRNLERGSRQMLKKNVGRDIHDKEDQEKMVLFKSVLARESKGCDNRALPRMYHMCFKNGYMS